jgi:hypothetical protein
MADEEAWMTDRTGGMPPEMIRKRGMKPTDEPPAFLMPYDEFNSANGIWKRARAAGEPMLAPPPSRR